MSCRLRGRTERPEDAAKNVSNPEDVDAGVGDDEVEGDEEVEVVRALQEEERAGCVVKLCRCSLPVPRLLPPPPLRPTDIDSRGHCSLTSLFHNRFHKSRHFLRVSGLQGVTCAPEKVWQVVSSTSRANPCTGLF